jgi:alpha-L-fucosidase 2
MLLQSHEGFINLLPALPDEWSKGSLRGFKVRGGATIDLSWKDGRVTEMTVTGGWTDTLKVKTPDGQLIEIPSGAKPYKIKFTD